MRNEIGLRIARLREEKGLSQQQLTEELEKYGLKVRRETVTQWENGTRDLKTEYTIKLSEYFNVSADYLLGLSDIPTRNETMQGVHDLTGLSQESIIQLVQLKEDFGYAPLLSALIESPHFVEVLHKIYGALWCKKSPAQREIESWPQFGKDLFAGGNGQKSSNTIQEALRAFSRYSDEFVIVPRLAQSISYLQEAQREIMKAAEDAIQNVESNHSMDNILLMAAKMELHAFCGNDEDNSEVDNG